MSANDARARQSSTPSGPRLAPFADMDSARVYLIIDLTPEGPIPSLKICASPIALQPGPIGLAPFNPQEWVEELVMTRTPDERAAANKFFRQAKKPSEVK